MSSRTPPDARRGPLAAARRFATSVPGQILVNTAAFTLPEELRIRSDWRVLDVACGRAGVVRVLAERARLEHPPFGIDPSRRMLRLAQRDMATEGGPPIALTQGSGAALPFGDDAFELVLCGHAFKYLSDGELRSWLAEARRVLRLGGLCLAWEFAPTASGLLDRWNRWLLTRQGPDVRLRGYRQLRAIALAAGFDWVQQAYLRPFLVPPIPRVSLIMGKAPPGWERRVVDGRVVLQYAPPEG